MSVGEEREAACWGYSDRPDRPVLGSVLDAFGERPTVGDDLVEAVVDAADVDAALADAALADAAIADAAKEERA